MKTNFLIVMAMIACTQIALGQNYKEGPKPQEPSFSWRGHKFKSYNEFRRSSLYREFHVEKANKLYKQLVDKEKANQVAKQKLRVQQREYLSLIHI